MEFSDVRKLMERNRALTELSSLPVVVMKDGVIQQVASPKEIYDHPKNLFVASFIGSPQMNTFYGKTYEFQIKARMDASEMTPAYSGNVCSYAVKNKGSICDTHTVFSR